MQTRMRFSMQASVSLAMAAWRASMVSLTAFLGSSLVGLRGFFGPEVFVGFSADSDEAWSVCDVDFIYVFVII